jgi:hypothetical protein
MRPDLSVPSFELEGAAVPRQREVGEQTFSFVVTNTGDVPGTFRGVVQWQYPAEHDADEWFHLPEALSGELPPGKTKEFATSSDYDGDLVTRYRMQPFGYEWEIQP